MIKRTAPAFMLLFCVYLDIIFFALVNISGARPDAMLSFTVSCGVLMGPYAGAALGAAGGMLSDLLSGPALGLNSAMYLMCGIAGGFFYRKFYADNVIIPTATAAACGLAKELIMAFIRFAGGARFPFAEAMIRYILPGAVMSGALCLLIHIILKKVIVRQTKSVQSREKLDN